MYRNLLYIGVAAVLAVSYRGLARGAERSNEPWRVGMSAALSGPAGALGSGMRDGIEAHFQMVNARGGVHGRHLRLIVRDDAYEPSRTAPNMRALAEEDRVFACIGNVGTPTAAVAVPIANEKRLPLVGAFTGAGLLRKTPPDRYIINFRASYAEETAKMVHGLVDELQIKPESIGFFTQNDAYGDAGWKSGVEALKAMGYDKAELLPHGRYTRNTVDVEDGLSRLLDPRHDVRAVIMVGAYKPCARFIRLSRQHQFHPVFLNLSFVGSGALKQELGDAGEGVVVTQVVPLPEGDSLAAREFQQAVPQEMRNFVSFEGFLTAKSFVLGLMRSGPHATPETFIDALESGHSFDLGIGANHKLSKLEHQISHRVWPTVIRGGQFVALEKWNDLKLEEVRDE